MERETVKKGLASVSNVNLWPHIASALVGVVVASILGVNALTERSIADQKVITQLQTDVRALNMAISAMQAELARFGERIENLRENNRGAQGK